MARDNYNERKEARIERYKELSERNSVLSTSLSKEARDMTRCIPMGQPILVGHHSEAGHRRLLERSWNKMGKSVEAGDKASYYAEKAKIAENNNAISSDDPEAITKLKEKVASLESAQKRMKEANKVVRKISFTQDQKVKGLEAIGYSIDQAKEILTPDFAGRVGFPGYVLTNNNATIKTAKNRLEKLQKELTEETTERLEHGIRIVDSIEVNRLQFFFDGKPDEVVRLQLKQNGFRWSGRNGCWQAYRSAKGWRESIFLRWYEQYIKN
ncbi:MAG: DUF3560 domain-containing protein [Carboxylicivirga sp.]|jgi:hypothetical protein|nr:DUF3560 domain-containing protein [Carboxylicivirga sp.]